MIGAYDVPAIWTRVGRPGAGGAGSSRPPNAPWPRSPPTRTPRRGRGCWPRSRWSRAARARRAAREAAREAEAIARRLDDPALLAFALNGRVHADASTGRAWRRERDAIGAELVDLSARHGLVTFEVLGHLIRLQARCALADFAAADAHAAAADELAARHELPLVGRLHRASTRALKARHRRAAYRDAAARLDGAGMPGLEHGLLGSRCSACASGETAEQLRDADCGPYEPWAAPLVPRARARAGGPRGAAQARSAAARPAVRGPVVPHRPRGASALDDERTLARARDGAAPGRDEFAAGSGIVALGPIVAYLG